MFKIKIKNNEKETNYIVYGEQELALIGNVTSSIVSCPNYFDLKLIPTSKEPIMIMTNNVPIIVDADNILNTNYFTTNINFDQTYPLDITEYKNLHDLYLEQMATNPTEEFLNQQNIKDNVNSVLVKKH